MTDISKQEIQRWLNDPNELLIWVKERENMYINWHKQLFINCAWNDNCIHIIDDNQAELRKLQFDEPDTIFQYWDEELLQWKILQPITWDINIKYAIKPKDWFNDPAVIGKLIWVRNDCESNWYISIFQSYTHNDEYPFEAEGNRWKFAKPAKFEDYYQGVNNEQCK